jgi:hypothetical protein
MDSLLENYDYPRKNNFSHFMMNPNILSVGYDGANNTGAEAKFLALFDKSLSVPCLDACITIPSLNETALRRRFNERTLEIKTIGHLFSSGYPEICERNARKRIDKSYKQKPQYSFKERFCFDK